MYQTIDPKDFVLSPVKKIGDEWLLITAGDKFGYNTMTASWGALGVMWNRPAATCYIRPNRYTYEFIEKNDIYTLCFFDEAHKPALSLLGKKSGRDGDKITEAGLTPICDEETGAMYFSEATTVIFVKKMFFSDLKNGTFHDETVLSNYSETNPMHRMYIGEILKIWEK